MNKRPIDQVKDRDLRLSQLALQRAAQRARDLAAATGTAVLAHVERRTSSSNALPL
jgi:hypothetical protein